MSHFPEYRGQLEYSCLSCFSVFPIDSLLYTCPSCGGVLLLKDTHFDSLKKTSGDEWRNIFDSRAASKKTALRGIFRFYELIAPVLEPEDIIYLGEGNTPIVEASLQLQDTIGISFAYKNDGQNPSASFKDRGMACAFSYLKALIRKNAWSKVLTICASTGDTSAAAALYAAYLGDSVDSVVLLPHGKVTPQQLAQPLGSGATVLEIPGVFDDCMRVVESLAEEYNVALLNSKNSWRILGQESYAYEVAQWYDWDVERLCLFVPIGNAGNITAILNGFLKLHALGIITALPRIFGVQSEHANPVYSYYAAPKDERVFTPVQVRPSVAQAAMIGNPVSFPRVHALASQYQAIAGENSFQVVEVQEQDIMDSMLEANRHGHIACTQGGECLAGLRNALKLGLISKQQYAVLDSTAHALKFMDFQNEYFEKSLDAAYEVTSQAKYINSPKLLLDKKEKEQLSPQDFVRIISEKISKELSLVKKS